MKKSLMLAGAVSFALALPVGKYLRADFTQRVENIDANTTLFYKGRMAVRLPDGAKWIYTEPVKKTICLTGLRAWVIEPQLEQATLYRLSKSLPILEILSAAKPDGHGGYIALYGGTEYEVRLDEQKRLQSIAYTDELGNRVRLRFFNVSTEPFDEALLTCRIPDGFDIIDESL